MPMTPYAKTYDYPDDIGLLGSALGGPFGFFQQFVTVIEWDSPQIIFDKNGTVPIGKEWPWD